MDASATSLFEEGGERDVAGATEADLLGHTCPFLGCPQSRQRYCLRCFPTPDTRTSKSAPACRGRCCQRIPLQDGLKQEYR